MSLEGVHNEPMQFSQPTEAKQEVKVANALSERIGRVGAHCLDSLKLLESHEERLLTGSIPNQNDLDTISEEISVLKGIVTEHKGEVGNDKQAAQLLAIAEKRLETLESKYNSLKTSRDSGG